MYNVTFIEMDVKIEGISFEEISKVALRTKKCIICLPHGNLGMQCIFDISAKQPTFTTAKFSLCKTSK